MYAAWRQRQMCVHNLSRVATWQQTCQESNSEPFDHESDVLSTEPYAVVVKLNAVRE